MLKNDKNLPAIAVFPLLGCSRTAMNRTSPRIRSYWRVSSTSLEKGFRSRYFVGFSISLETFLMSLFAISEFKYFSESNRATFKGVTCRAWTNWPTIETCGSPPWRDKIDVDSIIDLLWMTKVSWTSNYIQNLFHPDTTQKWFIIRNKTHF